MVTVSGHCEFADVLQDRQIGSDEPRNLSSPQVREVSLLCGWSNPRQSEGSGLKSVKVEMHSQRPRECSVMTVEATRRSSLTSNTENRTLRRTLRHFLFRGKCPVFLRVTLPGRVTVSFSDGRIRGVTRSPAFTMPQTPKKDRRSSSTSRAFRSWPSHRPSSGGCTTKKEHTDLRRYVTLGF